MVDGNGRTRRLALTLVVGLSVIGFSTVASARPAVHRATPDDVSDGTWTASQAPVPAHAPVEDQRVWITGTACPAAGSCVAVGYYNIPGGSLGLIDTISDGTSTLTAAPVPPHSGQGSLTGITCSSVAFCVAIGSYGSDLGLVDTLSDGTWTATEAPLPPGTPKGSGVTLSAVTCPADGSCVLVGGANFTVDGSPLQTIPFIDTLTDGSWTSTNAPVPANAVTDFYEDGPTAVSCPAVGSCVATGTYHYDTTDNVGLVDTLADGGWTAQAAPAPLSSAADQNLNLTSVACPGPGWCVAIGQFDTAGPFAEGVIETLSGGSWAVTEAPIPEGVSTEVQLLGLACPAVGSCEIVGSFAQSGGAIAEDLSGGTWTPSTVSGPNSLSAVACPAVESCLAVGGTNGGGSVPVVATLADGDWTSAAAPVPANGGDEPALGGHNPNFPGGTLWSVSCATIDSCAALGQYSVQNPTPGQNIPEALIETLGLGGVPSPLISGADQATFTAGQPTSVSLTATGPSTPVFSEKGKLPKGLRFKTAGGSATITGKPSNKAGRYPLVITATSAGSNERVAQPFLVTVDS
jgi:hypothetical protein